MTAEEYIKAYTRGCSNELVHGGYHEWLTPENALAAVELAREERKEPISEDLQEHIDECWQTWVSSDNNPIANGDLTKEEFEFYARHFAQWQREQMMKDAFSCEVDFYDGKLLAYTQGQLDSALERIGAKVGEKVKILILPSDNK